MVARSIEADDYALDTNDNLSYKTVSFSVYQLNLNSSSSNPNTLEGDGASASWFDVSDSLGSSSLFLGLNHSASFSHHNFPGCNVDSIYFTDDFLDAQARGKKMGAGIGIFNYKNKTIYPLLPPHRQHHYQDLVSSLPVWLLLNPYYY